jgi:3-oxoacyl-[acyl-carrier-protein] synthase-1
MSFDSLGAFSLREDEPECASRPFDAHRDGLVPSGGAACLILENAAKARSRGARIYGTVAGYGFSSNSSRHLSRPSAKGARRAMETALADARASTDDIDYINAHATSTPVGDRIEAEAIKTLFGDKVPVSSTKSLTGHECWMAGASEALYTTIMAQEGFTAGNANFTRQEDEAPRINVLPTPTDRRIRRAVSNSFGFGGTNAVLVLNFDGYN